MSEPIKVGIQRSWPYDDEQRPTVVLFMSPAKALFVAGRIRDADPDLYDEVLAVSYPKVTVAHQQGENDG